MSARDEGLTKIYNRFHDPAEQSPDIVRLRELHAEMDRVVLRAYAASASNDEDAAGWNALADRAEPIFLDETNEDDHTYQGRLFGPPPSATRSWPGSSPSTPHALPPSRRLASRPGLTVR